MEYKIKEVGIPQQMMIQQGQYELSVLETIEEVDAITGKTVKFTKSVSKGIFNIADLIRQQEMLTAQLADVNEKIDAINSIINSNATPKESTIL